MRKFGDANKKKKECQDARNKLTAIKNERLAAFVSMKIEDEDVLGKVKKLNKDLDAFLKKTKDSTNVKEINDYMKKYLEELDKAVPIDTKT